MSMRKFLVSYKYIDKSFRERFGTISVNYFLDNNDKEINDFIYDEVENYLLTLGINVHEPNLNIRSCFSIYYIYEF